MGRFGEKGDNSRNLRTGEWALLKRVFRTARLPWEEITIGDGLSASGTAWTDSDYQINVGPDGFNADLSLWPNDSTLVHETTHVWQYYNHTLTKAHAFAAHVRAGATDWVQKKFDRVLPGHWEDDEAETKLYEYHLDGSWDAMGFEGQAQLVEDWYDMGMKTEGYRYVFVKYILWYGNLSMTNLTRTELARRYPEIADIPEIDIQDKAVAHEPAVPLTDSYLISLLQPRYAANDVTGFGTRARKVEQVFKSTKVAEALALFSRLTTRKAGDTVSMYFHDHLSSATRTKLLQILQDRTRGR